MSPSFDCIVVGSGPGGYVAAIRAARLGIATAVVERDDVVGGRCLNYACIPAKAVLRSADILSEVRDAGDFGVRVGEATVDFAAITRRRAKVISTLADGVKGLLQKNGVEVVHGEASLTPDGDVRVGDRALSAGRAVVLATGSVKRPLPGLSFGGNVIGTERAWALDELPETMVVIGAGASGTEIASAYARLGTRVTLYEGLDRVLPTEDADVSAAAARGFKKQGIDVRTSTFFGPADAASFDWVVIAAGRGPEAEALGLDAAGIELTEQGLTEQGLIAVDGAMRTSKSKVYAIGDLVPGPALAHKASDEGIIAVEDAAGLTTHPISYLDIPRATFCSPNVGSFGLTEAQAREQGYDVVVGKVPYGAVGAGTVYGDRSGVIKIVGDKTDGELLGRPHRRHPRHGAHPGAGERQAARGRLPRGGADDPRPPDAVGRRHGGGARRRRLAHPRLTRRWCGDGPTAIRRACSRRANSPASCAIQSRTRGSCSASAPGG